MAENFGILFQGYIPNPGAVLFTVPAAHQYIIKHITIVNIDSAVRQLTLWHGTAADDHLLLPAATDIVVGGWAECDAAITMDDGDTLRALCSVNNKMTITCHGLDKS